MKIEKVEFVWHQWTAGQSHGNIWHALDSDLETIYTSRVTTKLEGYGVHQVAVQYGYAEALGKTFGDDTHRLDVIPCTPVKVHLEMRIVETYGDTGTDYLHVWAYYTDGSYALWTFYNLPRANGGTITYDATIYSDTTKRVDRFEFLWHQWTPGQSNGNSWSIEPKTTIYWDREPSPYVGYPR
jgi:hypothetical protein